jgi:hypothetical protein
VPPTSRAVNREHPRNTAPSSTTKATFDFNRMNFPGAIYSLLMIAAVSLNTVRAETKTSHSGSAALKKENVLTLVNGDFHLDGHRFAEISFNKFDLAWSMHGERVEGRELNDQNPIVQAQERALINLKKLGFRSIRVFAQPWGEHLAEKFRDPMEHQRIFHALDKMVKLCEKHGVGLVWSLSCGSFTNDEQHLKDLVSDPESKNRQILYEYLDFVVDRYKHSPAVLMWEIHNELTLSADIGFYDGKRMPTLKEVAVFYDDVAKRIKNKDPLRLVSNGGSNPRESQWNLHAGNGWQKDTLAEQARCFDLLFRRSAVDVIDIHYYPNNRSGILIAGRNGKDRIIGLKEYMVMAKRVGKPLIAGEIGRLPILQDQAEVWKATPDYFDSFADTDAALSWIQPLLDEIVASRVQLSYWWAYQSDRAMDQGKTDRMDISLERDPEIVQAIVDANRRLKNELRIPAEGMGK